MAEDRLGHFAHDIFLA